MDLNNNKRNTEFDDVSDYIKNELKFMRASSKIMLFIGFILAIIFYFSCKLKYKIGTICSSHPFEVFIWIFLTCGILFTISLGMMYKY